MILDELDKYQEYMNKALLKALIKSLKTFVV